MASIAGTLLECGVAQRALPGQAVSGDLHVVRPFAGGTVVAVIDGIGHGVGAATAAAAAARAIEAYADQSVVAILEACHAATRDTRGVVLSVASFSAGTHTMTWAGVGNVEGALVRSSRDADPDVETILLRGGVVGHNLPVLTSSVLQVAPGDVLILATDGLDIAFLRGVRTTESPQALSERLLADHGKRTDDALVLTARYCK